MLLKYAGLGIYKSGGKGFPSFLFQLLRIIPACLLFLHLFPVGLADAPGIPLLFLNSVTTQVTTVNGKFPTSLCGVLVLLAAIPPDSSSSSSSSSSPPPLTSHTHTHTHSLTHSLNLTHSLHSLTPLTHSLTPRTTHSLTHSLHSLTPLTHSLTHTPRRLQRLRHSLTHSFTPLTPSLTRLQKGLQCPETAEGPAARSVQRLQKGLRRAWSPLGRLSPQCPETAAGPAAQKAAVSRACRRAAVSRDYRGPAARVVAAGPALSAVSRDCRRACGAEGRSVQRLQRACSVQRLQKGLRRAWSPLGRLSPQCPEALRRAWSPLGRLSPQCPETAEGPAARVVAAGPALSAVSRDCRRACSVQRLQKRVVAAGPALSAVSRDCRRACGARGRRWAGSLRSVQRLQQGLQRRRPQCPETAEGPQCPETTEGLRRARSPLGRLSPQCPDTAEGPRRRRPQCPETAEGPAVSRDCRRACGARGRRWAGSLHSVQRLQKGLRRAWSPLGRLSPQCRETAEGPAARAGSLRSVQRLQKGLRRAWSPLGRLSPQCPETAAGPAAQKAAVSRDCRRACGARGRRWAGSLRSVQSCRRACGADRRSVQRLQKGLRRVWSPLGRLSPQCPETAEGSAARVVAAGPALSAVSRDCRRACGARGRRWAPGGSVRDCDFHSIGSCRCGVAL